MSSVSLSRVDYGTFKPYKTLNWFVLLNDLFTNHFILIIQVDSEKETKSKKKAKKEATSILDKYKDDAKFQDFLRIHKRNAESWTNESIIEVATLYKEENKDKAQQVDSEKDDKENLKTDTDENSNKKKPKKEKDYFHVKLSNLPYKFKKKEVKLFLNPLKPPSIRMPPKNHGIAYVGFRTEKERNQALNKHKSLWEGHQIFVAKYEKKDGGSQQPAGGGGKENAKWKEQEAGVADTETVGESGRIFVRNLSYTVTGMHILSNEIAETKSFLFVLYIYKEIDMPPMPPSLLLPRK